MSFDPGLDLFPLLAGTLAAVCCGLLGNFLVLRRLSLMGDAISHSVLPGLVVAFLLTGTRSPVAMLVGAAVAGLATVALVEVVRRFGRVEPGAAMGVVFSVLFALGVLALESAAAENVDLDADCVLHGQLETLVWYGAPPRLGDALGALDLDVVPRQVTTLAIATLLAVLFVGLLFKELRLAAFDPALATTLGFHAGALHGALMVAVAVATVASFEAVGSILVIAMLVCPAATARLLTDRLLPQLAVSVAAALLAGAGGYLGATAVPGAFGLDSVNAAGSIAVTAGLLLAVAAVAAPRHGALARALRRRSLAVELALDDVLGHVYRAEEAAREPVTPAVARARLSGRPGGAAIARGLRRGLLERAGEVLRLTAAGEARAAELVRRHRLWEHFLVEEIGAAPGQVHRVAEQLEHLPSAPPAGVRTDPHGRQIPGAEEDQRPPA